LRQASSLVPLFEKLSYGLFPTPSSPEARWAPLYSHFFSTQAFLCLDLAIVFPDLLPGCRKRASPFSRPRRCPHSHIFEFIAPQSSLSSCLPMNPPFFASVPPSCSPRPDPMQAPTRPACFDLLLCHREVSVSLPASSHGSNLVGVSRTFAPFSFSSAFFPSSFF